MIKIQELIDQSIRDERDEKGEHLQRHWYISRLGSCPTGQYLERLGSEPDEPFDARTLRVFHCGRVFEDWIVGLLQKQTNASLETQVPVEDNTLDVSGYADIKLTENGTAMVYEVKSKHSRAFWYMVEDHKLRDGSIKKAEGANRQHEIQLWMYLKLLDIAEGRLVYVSKDDLTIAEYPVFRDDAVLEKEVMDTLTMLNKAWVEKTPPPPITDPADWRYKYCSYHNQCMQYARPMEAIR